MHELSIAMEIVDICEEFARNTVADNNSSPPLSASETSSPVKQEPQSIKEIEIEVGDMSGVVFESLEFALNMTVKNTMLENADISIIRIAGKANCNECKTKFKVSELYTPCPTCGKYDFTIIQGKELRVKSITIN